MAVSKGKEVAASTPESTSYSGKRKKPPPKPPSGKKTRRSGALQFIDDAAANASDDDSDELSFLDSADENEDEFDGDGSGFVNDIKPGLKDTKAAGKVGDTTTLATSYNLPFFLKEEDLSIEEQEKFVKERYGKDSTHVVFHEDIKISSDRNFNSQSMKGPPVWKVKCSVGCERQIAFCLFQKFVDVRSLGSTLPLISIFAIDHVKGHVFIEAEKESDCIEASRGLCKIYSSRLVPVSKEEISRLLSVRNTSNELSEGTWVRIKSGRYKGDLAEVMIFDKGKKRALVKLVPRIDLQALAKKFGGGESLKQSAIPSPRLISSRELEDFRPHIQIKRDRLTGEYFDVLDGLLLKDGYLYKKLSIASLSYMGIQPTKDELVKFEAVKKNDGEDLSWLSLVYGGRKRGHPFGESGDCLESCGRSSSCEVHDLVLFGRKSFGVVIGIKGDCIQILKGDVEKDSEVVTIQRKEIRSTCVDKIFTASDHNRKTICINDIVRVLEGPLEGKEGLVRHMYKGTLFVYNETQTDNCGFFSVKSQLCKNIKQSKGTKSDKIGSSSTPANADSTDSVGVMDSESSFKRPPRMEKDQPFSVGQTLRIRVGPLKGYLCRVVSLYRSNVTVKLDSLVKVITVEAKDLSEVSTKSYGGRDSSAMAFGNQFVSQEKPTDDVWGAPLDRSSWNLDLPSISRGSWHDYSASTFSIPNPVDDRMGIDRAIDQWSSKLIPREGDQAIEPNEGGGCWDKAVVSGGGLSSSWDIPGGRKDEAGNWENDSGTWKKNIPSTSTSGADTWEKSRLPCDNADIIWGEKLARDGNADNPPVNVHDNWAMKMGKHNNRMDSWSIPESSNCGKTVDIQSQANEALNEKSEGWRSSEADDRDPKNAWNTKAKFIRSEDDTWQKASTSQSKENIDNVDGDGKKASQSTDLCASQAYSDGQPNLWEAKGKNIPPGSESDAWDKAVSQAKIDSVDDCKTWGKTSRESKCDTNLGKNISESESDSWNQPESLHASGSHAKSNITGVDGSNKWKKNVATPTCGRSEQWEKVKNNSSSDPFPSGGWGQASDQWTAPTPAHCVTDSWDNTKALSGRVSDHWEKAKVVSEGKANCWPTSEISSRAKEDSWAQGESCSGWKQERSHGQPSGCDSWVTSKSENGGQTDNWRKEKPSTGARSDSSDCFKCGQPGHLARECPSAGGNDGGRSSDCYKCGKPGHFARECPSADHGGTRQSNCYKCGQPGHFARECPSAEGSGAAKRSDCFKCGQSGHLARECPSAGSNDGGRSSDCFKCGQPGHFARECSSANVSGGARSSDCYKCGQPGHFARDCPSAVGNGASRSSGCYKCGEAGHLARECTSSSAGDGNKSSRSIHDGDGTSGKGWGNQFERSSQRDIYSPEFSGHNLTDTKSDKAQGWDQWDSKLKPLDGERSTQSNEEKVCWDKKGVSDTSLNIDSGLRKQAGSWGNDSGGCSGEIDVWEKGRLPNDDSGRSWRDDSLDRKQENPCTDVNDLQRQNNQSGSWSIRDPNEWSNESKSKVSGKENSREESGYWNKSQSRNHNPHNAWNAKGETADAIVDDAWQKNSASQSKEERNNSKQDWEKITGDVGLCSSQPFPNERPNSWDVKGENVSGNKAYTWGKPTSQGKITSDGSQVWGKSSGGSDGNNTSFDVMGKNTSGSNADVWGKSSSHGKASSVDNVSDDDDKGWGKISEGSNPNSSWDMKGKNVLGDEADGWNKRDGDRDGKGLGKFYGGAYGKSSVLGGWTQTSSLHSSGGHTISSANVNESNQSGKIAISSWSQSEKWERANINPTSNSSKSLDWGEGSDQGAEPTSSRDPINNWGNPKSSTGFPVEKWEKSKVEAGGETGGWQKSGTPLPVKEDSWSQGGSSGCWKQGGNQGQSNPASDVWAASNTAFGGEAVSWEKARAPAGDHSGSWSRAKDSSVGGSCRSTAPSSGRSDCFKCGQPGHFARECPSADGSGGRTRGSDCFKCGQPGHFARECPSADGSGRTRGSDCYKCGQPGHFARECPSADGVDRSVVSSRSNYGAGSGSRGSWSGGSEQAWP